MLFIQSHVMDTSRCLTSRLQSRPRDNHGAHIFRTDGAARDGLLQRGPGREQRGTGLVVLAFRKRSIFDESVCAAHVGFGAHQLCTRGGDVRVLAVRRQFARALRLRGVGERRLLCWRT